MSDGAALCTLLNLAREWALSRLGLGERRARALRYATRPGKPGSKAEGG
ncbi:MAG: hypothetical protein AAGH19_01490 [Pseudomonadota bacterium]